MKKGIVVLCAVFGMGASLQAQTWDEWFRQRKTKREYLLKQIAALKVYANYLKEGYQVAQQGLQTIQAIKNGDFSLHQDMFASFRLINPHIQKYGRIADIIVLQTQIFKTVNQTITHLKESGQYSPKEIEWCKHTLDGLLTETLMNMEELFSLLTAGELAMKDDERLKRIDNLHKDMQDKYGLAASFAEDINLTRLQRILEQQEVELSKKILGLH